MNKRIVNMDDSLATCLLLITIINLDNIFSLSNVDKRTVSEVNLIR